MFPSILGYLMSPIDEARLERGGSGSHEICQCYLTTRAFGEQPGVWPALVITLSRKYAVSCKLGLLAGTVLWITATSALEEWGGTICISKLTYISRHDIMLVAADQHLADLQAKLGDTYTPKYDLKSASEFVRSHPTSISIRRRIFLTRPLNYFEAMMMPFRRDIEAPAREKPIDDSFSTRYTYDHSSVGLFEACDLSDRLSQMHKGPDMTSRSPEMRGQ